MEYIEQYNNASSVRVNATANIKHAEQMEAEIKRLRDANLKLEVKVGDLKSEIDDLVCVSQSKTKTTLEREQEIDRLRSENADVHIANKLQRQEAERRESEISSLREEVAKLRHDLHNIRNEPTGDTIVFTGRPIRIVRQENR